MTKGRRLTTSRSERLLGSYGYNHGQEMVNEWSELREDDVWSVVEGGGNHYDQSGGWSPGAPNESNGSLSSYSSGRYAQRPSSQRQVGGLSLAFDDSGRTTSQRVVHQFRGNQDGAVPTPCRRQMATSAPLNVPDWSKIYRADSVESLHDSDDNVDDQDSEWVPPHEYLAREYARSRGTAANSVFEGVGRTLKGRDMSRVRDAVWSQTGFDG